MTNVQGCPVSHNRYAESSEIYGHYALLDAERDAARFHFNDTTDNGFWMLTRYDDVLEGFQKHAEWTTESRSALYPDTTMRLLPQDLNGDEHAKLRRVINPFFAPAAIRRMNDLAHSRCIELIEELAPQGKCNFVTEFAIRYPTDIFLTLLGLPVSDGEFFVEWSEDLLNAMLAGYGPEVQAPRTKILTYFEEAIADRRANPRDAKEDLLTRLIEAEIDGEEITHDDILLICMSLMLAGLDTTRSALGYIYAHLAQHDEDRQLIVDDLSLCRNAVEEFIRMYPLVIQAGRRVQTDTEFHGIQMAERDVVWLGVGSANRDPERFPEPDKFIIDRDGLNQHLAFGAGPHRCIGMHLARLELAVVLEEWHKRIPNYRIADGTVLTERGSQLTLTSLPLEWDV